MKFHILLVSFALLLAGCSSKTNVNSSNIPTNNQSSVQSQSSFNNRTDITKENYERYFSIYNNTTFWKTTVTPLVSKHLIYENVVFNFRSTYKYTTYSSGSGQLTQDEVFEYSLTIDETGKAEGKYVDQSHQSRISNGNQATFGELVSVSGCISFDLNGARVTRLLSSDNKQSLNKSYYTSNSDKITYKANYSYIKDSDTDALYSIEKVTASFKGVVNNVEKTFTYTFNPDLFGEAEIITDVHFTSYLTKESFNITNGFLIEYI